MALKKFIGARYAPEFAGEWSNTKQYAALSVVYTDNRSYVSRKTVPAGTAISNTEFWIQSSDWNAQVAEYNLKVEGYNANVEQYNKNVEDYAAAVSGFYADTLHSFDTKAEMQADKTLALGETLLTCGDKAIGDGGGSFYQVVAQTSVTAVALDNGLYAEPFEFQPYDYSQFQKEVEGYKDSTTRVYNVQADMVADTGINAGNVLMTTGAVEQGDGQGSFWNVSDEQSEGAVALNNGKYAKKFNLTSVDVSGNLLFNGKGNQVAIWGIKAGGEAVNVPVSYALGETRTVYVAVEYTPDNTNATVNLVVSGPTSFTKTFAWSDGSVTSGQVKTVMYAITVHSAGNNVYTGAQTVTSYLTTLSKFVETLKVSIPNEAAADQPWNASEEYGRYGFPITTSSPIIVHSTTSYTSTTDSSARSIAVSIVTSNPNNRLSPDGCVYTTAPLTSTATKNIHTGYAAMIPGVTYYMYIAGADNTGFYVSGLKLPTAVTGNYGTININNGKYAGTISYTPFELSNQNANIPDSSNPAWNNTTSSRDVTIPFSVNKNIYLESFTMNTTFTGTYPRYVTIRSSDNKQLYYFETESNKVTTFNAEIKPYIYLPAGAYRIQIDCGGSAGTMKLPAAITGTYGPFVFTNSTYSGIMKYTIIDN